MLIQGKQYHTIWINQENKNEILVIDQRKLPFTFETYTMDNVEKVFFAIQDMIVRGAPLIGVTGAYGLYLALLQKQENWKEHLKESAKYLISARPTAINLENVINSNLKKILELNDRKEAINYSLQLAEEKKQKEIDYCESIGNSGLEIIQEISKKKNEETVNILTHCNAGWLACIDWGTATAPVYKAFKKGIKLHVWVDETRPRNQGAKLTAFELGEMGVPHTIIADNTGGHLMQHGMVDLVIVGSDRTTYTGDVANKIGTYLKALAANDNNIPFYAALPSTTFDWKIKDGIKQIPIETRSQDEVKKMDGKYNNEIISVEIMPEKSPALNYGFDVTPARLVTGLITERGICSANKESIYQLFPEQNNEA